MSAVTLLMLSDSVGPGDLVWGKAGSPGWPGRSSLIPRVGWMTVAGLAIPSSRPCSATCVNPEGLDKNHLSLTLYSGLPKEHLLFGGLSLP